MLTPANINFILHSYVRVARVDSRLHTDIILTNCRSRMAPVDILKDDLRHAIINLRNTRSTVLIHKHLMKAKRAMKDKKRGRRVDVYMSSDSATEDDTMEERLYQQTVGSLVEEYRRNHLALHRHTSQWSGVSGHRDT